MAQRPVTALLTKEWKWHSWSVPWHEPKQTGLSQALDISSSKVLRELSCWRMARAMQEASSSVGCIRTNDMPTLDQSVLRKIGMVESKQARQGSLVMVTLSSSNRVERGFVQAASGMDLQWWSLARWRNGWSLISAWGM